MKVYKIFWHLSDSGKEFIKANSEEEALSIFREMSLEELLGYANNTATVGRVNEEEMEG